MGKSRKNYIGYNELEKETLMEPNFILKGEPYGPVEKKRLEQLEKVKTWDKIQKAYHKIELTEAAIDVIIGVGLVAIAAIVNTKTK